ncbi:MAG TPA: AMP-binding protein [Tepidisphaeraceae bacterium]|nr:AMP-binding protein [Tepidisphaeraceae bacterium]
MLFESLFQHADRKPHELAVADDTGRYTWQQYAAFAAGLGMYLSAQTDRPRVGLLLPTSMGFAASFYGTLLAGKGVVPINFLLGEREVAHIIADSGIDTIVTIPPLASKLKDVPLKIVDLTQLPKVPPAAITPKFPNVQASDVAVLMYTSGTSGLPKGVQLTYGNLASDVDAAIQHAQLQGSHSFIGIVPLFHSTGLLATLIAPVRLGSTVHYQARFSAVAVMNAVREQQVSILVAVPSMYGALLRLKDAGPESVKSLYAAISGGEPLPSTIREGWQRKFGIPLYEGYGLTETIGPIAFNVPGGVRPGSVGRLIPGAQARITDDEGKPLAAEQTGEVWLKGPMIMKGYHNLPDETAKALTPDGFFKTGDLGHLDPDGYLHITGRKKDLIIVAGEKASPREIEEVIAQHPAVAEAAVVGKKDASRGEVVVAFVTARDGQTIRPEEIREFCRGKALPQWKVPREVFVETDLPRTPTGKVLKRVLSDRVNTGGAESAGAAAEPTGA